MVVVKTKLEVLSRDAATTFSVLVEQALNAGIGALICLAPRALMASGLEAGHVDLQVDMQQPAVTALLLTRRFIAVMTANAKCIWATCS